jgi:hypothetical protein
MAKKQGAGKLLPLPFTTFGELSNRRELEAASVRMLSSNTANRGGPTCLKLTRSVGCVGGGDFLSSARMGNGPHHRPRWLILSLTLIRDRPQKAALCPGQEFMLVRGAARLC